MNYRHIYHAGNYADVFKHIILVEILQKLRDKEKPFCIIDTHAGLGLYSLKSLEAQKTLEYEKGILKFLRYAEEDPDFESYIRVIKSVNGEDSGSVLKNYPGSPYFSRFYLRKEDRLRLCELHPEDVKILQKYFDKDRRVKVFHQDAYDFLKAVLPPMERRGLVLMDPPFEKEDEFDRMIKGLQNGFKRFSYGIYALWYPIKDIRLVEEFYGKLHNAGFANLLSLEMVTDSLKEGESLRGCGMAILNPPWQLEEKMKIILPKITQYLNFDGKIRIERSQNQIF